VHLGFDVPDEIGIALQKQAEAKGISISQHLAELVQSEVQRTAIIGWPDGYFEAVFGKWQGEPLRRPET
jgi:hypothetical protein